MPRFCQSNGAWASTLMLDQSPSALMSTSQSTAASSVVNVIATVLPGLTLIVSSTVTEVVFEWSSVELLSIPKVAENSFETEPEPAPKSVPASTVVLFDSSTDSSRLTELELDSSTVFEILCSIDASVPLRTVVNSPVVATPAPGSCVHLPWVTEPDALS